MLIEGVYIFSLLWIDLGSEVDGAERVVLFWTSELGRWRVTNPSIQIFFPHHIYSKPKQSSHAALDLGHDDDNPVDD